jgi:hypothetical protein
MRKKLTTAVECARAERGERIEIWDTLLPAFGIRVGPKRSTWMVAQRPNGAKHPVRVKLGTCPPMGLGEAREKARQLLAGEAPASRDTFSKLVDSFLAHGRTKRGQQLSRNTIDQYKRNLRRYAAPLHRRPDRRD